MFRKALIPALLSLLSFTAFGQAPRQRHFKFTYAFSVRQPDAGKPLKVWFPMAVSDEWQTVKILSATGDLPLKRTREPEYGDRIFVAQTARADKAEYRFQVVYDVVRSERIGLRNGGPVGAGERLSSAEQNRFLQPDKLVPVTGLPAELAHEETRTATVPLQKARAIYDYVFRTLRYDKTGTGWGRGDTLWACDSKRGNCTDFHSLFASMARSQGIPVRFAIGFSIPAGKHEGPIAGYHCWADFYSGSTWVPVDISEAWKDPSKRDYFFGAHDENRVQFSVGRDIRLRPSQAREPLNFFVYPYVESGGRTYENVGTDFSFSDFIAEQVQASAK